MGYTTHILATADIKLMHFSLQAETIIMIMKSRGRCTEWKQIHQSIGQLTTLR